jgi:hypothetical protein
MIEEGSEAAAASIAANNKCRRLSSRDFREESKEAMSLRISVAVAREYPGLLI